MDKSVIVLNKPSGLATQGGSGLTQACRRHARQPRLRKEHAAQARASSRSRHVRRARRRAHRRRPRRQLSRSLAERDAQKIYWALTKGVPKVKRGTIKAALVKEGGFGEHGRDERMTTVDKGAVNEKDAKDADHRLCRASRRAGEEFAWVAVKPLTGRTHQIRVHLAAHRHADRRRLQIWRHRRARQGRDRQPPASACPLHRYRTSGRRTAGCHRAACRRICSRPGSCSASTPR